LRARRIIETGFDAGMTTLILAQSGAMVLAVDDMSEYPAVKEQAVKRLENYPNVRLVKAKAVALLKREIANSIDLVFVDDDHSQKAVRRTAWEVKRVLRPGGIAAFHDVVYARLTPILNRVFDGWQMITLPAISPELDIDMGLGLVRKPGWKGDLGRR
jgi:predicted O-methyltransferase YrrM